MSRQFRAYIVVAAALFGAEGWFATSTAQGQNGHENVNFNTADGVKLRGAYYPADKKCLATVIMLHPIGEGKSIKVPEWKKLAESLQKSGYSVLMFDFRGHGESTEILLKEQFWAQNVNRENVKAKDKEAIDVKEYIKQSGAYLPILVNDIAAARAYLDRRNDNTKDCNTSSIIVVGVEQGATLGAIWINAECSRYKYIPPANPMFMKGTFDSRSEGADIIGAVFLSIDPKLDKSRKVVLASILKVPCKDNAMATLLLSGKDDAEFNKTLASKLKVAKSKKHDFIGPYELDAKLSGMKLLTKGLKAEAAITEYLGNVVEDRKVEWAEKEFDKSSYGWKMSNGKHDPARKKGEKTLIFDDYRRFMPQ